MTFSLARARLFADLTLVCFPMSQEQSAPPSLRLVVLHPVPSLNRLFGLHPWSRLKEKRSTQAAFLSALSATAADCSTPTTSAQSGFLMRVGIPALSATIDRKTSRSKWLREKSRARKTSAQRSH